MPATSEDSCAKTSSVCNTQFRLSICRCLLCSKRTNKTTNIAAAAAKVIRILCCVDHFITRARASALGFSIFRHHEGEPAPFPVFALKLDTRANQIRQLAAKMQSKALPFERVTGIHSFKSAEDPLLILWLDASAGVVHVHHGHTQSVNRLLAHFHSHRAHVGELDGVASQLEQDLGQRAPVRP